MPTNLRPISRAVLCAILVAATVMSSGAASAEPIVLEPADFEPIAGFIDPGPFRAGQLATEVWAEPANLGVQGVSVRQGPDGGLYLEARDGTYLINSEGVLEVAEELPPAPVESMLRPAYNGGFYEPVAAESGVGTEIRFVDSEGVSTWFAGGGIDENSNNTLEARIGPVRAILTTGSSIAVVDTGGIWKFTADGQASRLWESTEGDFGGVSYPSPILQLDDDTVLMRIVPASFFNPAYELIVLSLDTGTSDSLTGAVAAAGLRIPTQLFFDPVSGDPLMIAVEIESGLEGIYRLTTTSTPFDTITPYATTTEGIFHDGGFREILADGRILSQAGPRYFVADETGKTHVAVSDAVSPLGHPANAIQIGWTPFVRQQLVMVGESGEIIVDTQIERAGISADGVLVEPAHPSHAIDSSGNRYGVADGHFVSWAPGVDTSSADYTVVVENPPMPFDGPVFGEMYVAQDDTVYVLQGAQLRRIDADGTAPYVIGSLTRAAGLSGADVNGQPGTDASMSRIVSLKIVDNVPHFVQYFQNLAHRLDPDGVIRPAFSDTVNTAFPSIEYMVFAHDGRAFASSPTAFAMIDGDEVTTLFEGTFSSNFRPNTFDAEGNLYGYRAGFDDGGVKILRIDAATLGTETPDEVFPTVELQPADGTVFAFGETGVVSFECADDRLVASCTGSVPTDSPTTLEPGDHTVVVTAIDGFGNETVESVTYTVLPDTENPTVSIDGISNGQAFDLDQRLRFTYSCADNDEVASCTASSEPGTESLGLFSVTVTAVDGSGNTSSETVEYSVVVKRGLIKDALNMNEVVYATDYTPANAEVVRLYQAFFARVPDVGGTKYWLDVNADGHSTLDIAGYMTASNEFATIYSETSNEDFVTKVYANVLGRATDPVGYQYWHGLLNDGQLDRAGVVFYVTLNPEFINNYPFLPR